MVVPVVAEIILVDDGKLAVRAERKSQITQPEFRGLNDTRAIVVIFDILRRTDNNAADDKLVEMAVRPSEPCLKHLVQLGEVQVP